MSKITSSKSITSSLSRPTSHLLAPPRDRPMRNKQPLSSSIMISASTSPSISIIQPISAKAITNIRTRIPTPMATPTNRENDDSSSVYHHKVHINFSNRDLGLGLGLGFGGFSILALAALLIQNYKKRQRNHSSLRISNHIDNNGVFFTETPSIFKRKSASRQSKQSSLVNTKWRPQSFLGVVAGVIAARFSNQSPSNSSFAHFDESGTVDYDSLTYPQPLYSPVKATYQDM